MSHTYASNRVHVVFSTKERAKTLPQEFLPKLWPYMAGIARNHQFQAIQIGGTRDHVHALILLSPILQLAKAVQTLKGSSSHWINETWMAHGRFSWQEGYGAFSVSASQTDSVVKYIVNQEAHHRKRSFAEEFVELLEKHGVNYDPRYVLG